MEVFSFIIMYIDSGKMYFFFTDAQGCTYLFDLDYDKGDQNPYTIDAAKCGNVSHFINHSVSSLFF